MEACVPSRIRAQHRSNHRQETMPDFLAAVASAVAHVATGDIDEADVCWQTELGEATTILTVTVRRHTPAVTLAETEEP